MTLKTGEQVLSLQWVKVRGEPRLVVTRWQNNKRTLTYEPLPFRPYGFVKHIDAPKLNVSDIFDCKREATKLKTITGEYVVKTSVIIPQDIRQLRQVNDKTQFYEADIPYGKRVFVDLDLNLPTTYWPAYLDIETDPRGMTNKTMQEYDKRVVSVAIVDSNGNKHFFCEDDERVLFAKLNDALQYFTCIVSWSDFDFVYLAGRAQKQGYRVPFITMCEGIDLMYYFAQLVLKKTTNAYFKLVKAVEYMRNLGADVDEMPDLGVKDDYNKVWQFFENDRKSLETYNLADSYAMYQIDKTLRLSHGMYELMREFKIWPTEFRQHSKIDDIIKLRLARKRGVVLPNRPEQHYDTEKLRKQKADKIGAHVFEPVPGYHEHIIVLDFAGMYPSIMLSLNIGLDSLVDCRDSRAVFRTPNGACYESKDCINTEYLKLVQRRFEIYDAELHAAKPNTLEYAIATAKRLKTKLIKNADFGITGYKTGRMYNKDVFESVTSTGQALIKQASAYMSKKHNIPTIYGDTDSIFLKLAARPDVEKLSAIIKDLNEHLQAFSKKEFGAPIDTEIELDYYADRAYFTPAKKRYLMHVAMQDWPPKECDYVKIAGFETQRRDWCELAKSVQKMLFAELLKGRSPLELEKEYRAYFEQIKNDLFAGKLDEQIRFTKSIRADLKEYTSSLPHTRAAQILQDMGQYQQGSDIEYFVIGYDKKTEYKACGECEHCKDNRRKNNNDKLICLKPKKTTKLFIDTYPAIANRPAIRRSGYSYVWQSQVVAILERLGLYVNDASIYNDPAQKGIDAFFLRFAKPNYRLFRG